MKKIFLLGADLPVMSGVYSFSITVEITFILPKSFLKKSTKKHLNFSNYIFCSMWKTYHHLFFTYHSQMYFIKAFYCLLRSSIKKYLIKMLYYLLLPIITCRHFLLTYRTQKYFIKVFYYLAKTSLLENFTQMYQKSWSYAILFLRYGTWQI